MLASKDVISQEEFRLVIHRLLELAQKNSSSPAPLLVALVGSPGSGKTTLTKKIVKALNDSGVVIAMSIPMDGYHKYRWELDKMPNREEAYIRRGAPWTFDPVKMYRHMRQLKTTLYLEAPEFDHAAKDPHEGAIVIDVQKMRHKAHEQKDHITAPIASSNEQTNKNVPVLVLVEGLYMMYKGTEDYSTLAAVFDFRLYLKCSLDVSTERLTKRHMAAWGISEEEARFRAAGSDFINAQLVATTEENADMVVHSISIEASSL